MNDQFNPFRYIKASVYLIIIVAVVLGGFLLISLIRLDRQEDARRADPTDIPFLACNFTNTGAGAIVMYNAPYADEVFENFRMLEGVPYFVRSISTATDFIEVEVDGIRGYVDPFAGLTTGECGAQYIPRDPRPLSDFPTACAFIVQADAQIYTDPALTQTLASTQTGDVLTVLRAAEQSYGIVTDTGLTGWIAQSDGERRGACGALPTAETTE